MNVLGHLIRLAFFVAASFLLLIFGTLFIGYFFTERLVLLDTVTECRANPEWCVHENPRLHKALTEPIEEAK